MVGLRPPARDEPSVGFWIRHVRVGAALNAAAAVLGLVYCALSPDRPNRMATAVLLTLAATTTPLLFALPLGRIVRSRWGIVFFVGWSAGTCGFITTLGVLDDAAGLHSLLLVLILVFAAMAYPPAAVVVVGVCSIVGFVVVALVHRPDDAVSFCSGGVLVLSVVMCVLSSRNRERADERRRREEARFSALFRSASDLVTVVDPSGTIRYLSPSVEPLLGFRPDLVVGRPISEMLHPEDVAPLVQGFADLLAAGPLGTIRLQSRVLAAGGSWRHFETVATNLVDDPDLGAVVLTSRDVSDRVRLEDELRHSATHDPLTGLANRTLLLERVTTALEAPCPAGCEVALAFFDLDDFKTLNDSLGHTTGDAVLVAVAARLQVCVRAEDTAARLGGDEFAVLLPAVRPGEAEEVVDRILVELALPASVEGREVVLGASAGIASTRPGGTADELLRDADVAMYAAKGAGKGVASVFEPVMHRDVVERLELKADLRRAVDEDQLRLHYQPVVELASGRMTGVEALLRWPHARRGFVPPLAFIPLAEESGLIVEIGRWAVGEACRQLARWDDDGVRTQGLAMGVNVSARQLVDPGFADDVTAALSASRIDPARLTLEITESRLLEDPEGSLRRLGELRRLGVSLAVDDFGTGYSSLSHLERLPVDILKIDRSFIAGVADGGSALVGAILDLAAALGLSTVAEGIETEAQEAALRSLSCTWGQGFRWSPALPPDALAAYLERDAVAV